MALGMLSDPITFLITYYFFTALAEGLLGIVKISIISSAAAFPPVYLGNWLYRKMKGTRLTNIVITSFFMTILFWAVSRAIAMITINSPFTESDPITLTLTLLAITTCVTIFTYLGLYFSSKMQKRWTMPNPLNLYLSALLTITVFWTALTALLRVINYVIK